MELDDIERLLDAHMAMLRMPNVVRIDYAEKVTGGVRTGRRALVVGVIEKRAPSELREPDRPVPPTVTAETRAGRIELETDVVEEGAIVARNGAVKGGTLVWTEGMPWGGSLGVNIDYQGTYRLLSCAHVLTGFDPALIGKTIRSCEKNWSNCKPLVPVTGQVPVTYYYEYDPPNPVINKMDVAWGDITPQQGSPEIVDIGTPTGIRLARDDEKIKIRAAMAGGGPQSSTVLSLTARCRMQSQSVDLKRWIYSFWAPVIQLDAGSLTLGFGDSGSAVVADSDRAVVGLMFMGTTTTVYACPLL